jgi:hypothetical protein
MQSIANNKFVGNKQMGAFRLPKRATNTTTNTNTNANTNSNTNSKGIGTGFLGFPTSFLKKNGSTLAQGSSGLKGVISDNKKSTALVGGESSVLVISLVFVFGFSGMTSTFLSASQ